jgi:tricorn protease
MSDARYPNFDKSGKYIYFTASTNLGPAFSFAEMSNYPYQPTRSVYAIVCATTAPSPLAPESDEEKVAEEKKDEAKPGDKPEEKKADAPPAGAPAGPGGPAGMRPPAKKEPDPVRIDLEGIDQRIVSLPIPARNYIGLIAGKANLIYLIEIPQGATAPGFALQKYDLEKRKLDKAGEGITSFEISANGEKALLRQGFANWVIANTADVGRADAARASRRTRWAEYAQDR